MFDLKLAKNIRFQNKRATVGVDIYNFFNSDAINSYNGTISGSFVNGVLDAGHGQPGDDRQRGESVAEPDGPRVAAVRPAVRAVQLLGSDAQPHARALSRARGRFAVP